MKVTIKNIKSENYKNNINLYNNFMRFLQKQFPLREDIVVNFVGERVGKMTTGNRRSNSEINVLTKKRLTRDILRTLAHEWVHEYQDKILKMKRGPNIGGKNEDMANAEAGSIMKKFEKTYPKYEEKMYE